MLVAPGIKIPLNRTRVPMGAYTEDQSVKPQSRRPRASQSKPPHRSPHQKIDDRGTSMLALATGSMRSMELYMLCLIALTRFNTKQSKSPELDDKDGLWINLSLATLSSRKNRSSLSTQISYDWDLSPLGSDGFPVLHDIFIPYTIIGIPRARDEANTLRQLSFRGIVVDMGAAIYCPHKACNRSTGPTFESIMHLRLHLVYTHSVKKEQRVTLLPEQDSQTSYLGPPHVHESHSAGKQSVMKQSAQGSTSETELIKMAQPARDLKREVHVHAQQKPGDQDCQAERYAYSNDDTSVPASRTHSEYISLTSCSSCEASGRHNVRVRESIEDQLSVPNTIKCAIEDFLSSSIDWWPLSQPVRPQSAGCSRIEWEYVSAIERTLDAGKAYRDLG